MNGFYVHTTNCSACCRAVRKSRVCPSCNGSGKVCTKSYWNWSFSSSAWNPCSCSCCSGYCYCWNCGGSGVIWEYEPCYLGCCQYAPSTPIKQWEPDAGSSMKFHEGLGVNKRKVAE